MDINSGYKDHPGYPLKSHTFQRFPVEYSVVEELKISTSSALTDMEVRILDFERQWWRYAGAKDVAIQEQFQISAPRYYELLNHLIDRDDALEASPLLVRRLRRLREARVARRLS